MKEECRCRSRNYSKADKILTEVNSIPSRKSNDTTLIIPLLLFEVVLYQCNRVIIPSNLVRYQCGKTRKNESWERNGDASECWKIVQKSSREI